jgi:hypothetical protein
MPQESVMRIFVLSLHAAVFLLVDWCFPFAGGGMARSLRSTTHHAGVDHRLLRITSVRLVFYAIFP